VILPNEMSESVFISQMKLNEEKRGSYLIYVKLNINMG
jgi:hypothetical protein